MGKMGWSGGGHMTNKIITYTDRFKAASSGAGAANWISMYAQSDVRVPMPQSVEMYRALKALGVPVHLYVAPRQPHGWQELYHRLFKANVEMDWWERWIMGREYEWEAPPEMGK